jgi:hypothetical protein
VRCPFAFVVVACVACSNGGGSSATPQKSAEPERKLAGVYPENFKCDTITTPAALGEVLGGTVRQLDSPMSTPKGVPHPCNYEVQTQATEYWTYDIDCRDDMKQRADALFAQYKSDSAAMVQQYNAAADAGIKPTDAGVAIHAPEAAAEVAVGAKGLDHHGQGLIFIDDDAPCYVRVVGPDSARRLDLAKLIAKNLTFANAPMTPRPMP